VGLSGSPRKTPRGFGAKPRSEEVEIDVDAGTIRMLESAVV
jgi:hypothetical protein